MSTRHSPPRQDRRGHGRSPVKPYVSPKSHKSADNTSANAATNATLRAIGNPPLTTRADQLVGARAINNR